MPPLRFVRTMSCLLAATWSATATATPDFPAAVVQDLGLPGITIDPPQGCTLCHTTDSGGTSVKPFGSLLLQDGVQPYDEPSLAQALTQIEQDEPQLIEDIRGGLDPSDDASIAGNVHSPEYGCSVAQLGGSSGRGRPRVSFTVAALLLAAAWVARLRRWFGRRPLLPPPVARA
jgi:hypothetical protein